MNKKLIAFLSILSLSLYLPLIPVDAAVKEGGACTKAGIKSIVSGKTFTCIKSGKKLVWDKGAKKTPSVPTPNSSNLMPPDFKISTSAEKLTIGSSMIGYTITSTGGPIESYSINPEVSAGLIFDKTTGLISGIPTTVGRTQYIIVAKNTSGTKEGRFLLWVDGFQIYSTGPGGGTIFYDAGSQQSWGRYLEVAPNGWSGSGKEPKSTWCNLSGKELLAIVSDLKLKENTGNQIGKGKDNTNFMLAGCSLGAAVLAHSYKGGGKSDWFLPSKDELNELCKYVLCSLEKLNSSGLRVGYMDLYYWSSSGIDSAYFPWFQYFTNGQGAGGDYQESNYVRPIRAF